MTKHPPGNIPASVRDRLMNEARKADRPFAELLQYYAMERFLYRLSQSPHRSRLILKGALMFLVWDGLSSRPTMDIDMLGRMSHAPDAVVGVVKDLCQTAVADDGMSFDADSVKAEPITKDADYNGVRVKFLGKLGTARIHMQLDIGFADQVFPSANDLTYPTILDFPSPELMGYTMESAIAEKVQAMVHLGALNSRLKDFYDVWLLARKHDFEGTILIEAIRATFQQRNTDIPEIPTALSETFAQDRAKQAQWRAFLDKNRLPNTPANLSDVISEISTFLILPLAAVRSHQAFGKVWHPPGPWV